MSSIAASYGENPIFCAIEATHEQGILCWGARNSNSTGEQLQISNIPPLMGLSGGSGFLCGLKSQDQHAFCFNTNSSIASNIIPEEFANTRYVSIAAGEFHTCALRESSENVSIVDCWGGGVDLRAPDLPGDVISVISGRSFACALRRAGECICWDDDSSTSSASVLGNIPSTFESVSAGGDHVCGVERISGEAVCWGRPDSGRLRPPSGISFASLAAGFDHTCGIRQDTHGIECWGNIHDASDNLFPGRTAFLAFASGEGVTCGIREWNLLAECRNVRSSNSNLGEYSPPLELLSPGLCIKVSSCSNGQFNFNATNHGVPVDGIIRSQLCDYGYHICSPCATQCPSGSFMASQCRPDEDVICVECGLCATAECEEWCKSANILSQEISKSKTSIIIVISVSAGFLFVVGVVIIHKRVVDLRKKQTKESSPFIHQTLESQASSGSASMKQKQQDFSSDYQVQAFRLSELRDATNGFKEMNEIGRGSYGIVYKGTIFPEGTHLAVKRASAARRIECSSKDFETELEVLTKTRHANLVNLVGYCDQVGERLLVYEFMHNGSLHDHLHEEHEHATCPIANNWINRLSIASQAARAIEFLHSNKVVHGNVKCANIMIDREWKARVADFAIISNLHPGSKEGDVYEFGVLLLEIVTGKKTGPLDPPVKEEVTVVDWAVPLIKLQKLGKILDSRCSTNNASMSQVANLAVSCLGASKTRPLMAEVANSLEELLESSQQHHHHHHHHETTTTTCINFRDKLHLQSF